MIFKYRQSTDVPDRAFDNNNIRYQVKQELLGVMFVCFPYQSTIDAIAW